MFSDPGTKQILHLLRRLDRYGRWSSPKQKKKKKGKAHAKGYTKEQEAVRLPCVPSFGACTSPVLQMRKEIATMNCAQRGKEFVEAAEAKAKLWEMSLPRLLLLDCRAYLLDSGERTLCHGPQERQAHWHQGAQDIDLETNSAPGSEQPHERIHRISFEAAIGIYLFEARRSSSIGTVVVECPSCASRHFHTSIEDEHC